MSTAISVQQISKCYILNHKSNSGYSTFRETLVSNAKKIVSPKENNATEEFWALHNISFEVNQGDRLGIIGKNGAGKSTLLKIISRIVEPTSGKIFVKGRIASLLEVGTGFHPELTGRENIFLNGAILGMSRTEIKKNFDAIVDFSGVEKFLDTPVKRYSSGMYVRLAFAVAAHLQPEILIVDEVLAVGDAEFQKKCLGKMNEVSSSGRTILFVSHNLSAINSLCNKALVVKKGENIFFGDVSSATNKYLAGETSFNETVLSERKDRTGNGKLKFTTINYFGGKHNTKEIFTGDNLIIQLGFETELTDLEPLIISVLFSDNLQNPVAAFVSDEMGVNFKSNLSTKQVELHIPQLLLRGGRYSVRLLATYKGTGSDSFCDLIENVTEIAVMSGDFWKSGKLIRDGQYAVMKGDFK